MPSTSRASVDGFLALKRLAVAGVSSKPADFSRAVFRKFVECGYDAIPVNPNVTEVEGRRCFARLSDISPAPDGVLVMTAPAVSEQIVRECVDLGIRNVWLHRGGGQGAVSIAAVKICKDGDIDVVAGECPLMFQPGGGFPHNFHGWIKKLTGAYPR